MMLAVFVEKC